MDADVVSRGSYSQVIDVIDCSTLYDTLNVVEFVDLTPSYSFCLDYKWR